MKPKALLMLEALQDPMILKLSEDLTPYSRSTLLACRRYSNNSSNTRWNFNWSRRECRCSSKCGSSYRHGFRHCSLKDIAMAIMTRVVKLCSSAAVRCQYSIALPPCRFPKVEARAHGKLFLFNNPLPPMLALLHLIQRQVWWRCQMGEVSRLPAMPLASSHPNSAPAVTELDMILAAAAACSSTPVCSLVLPP
eukprot:TRINITY_DN22549_c0_g2_i1.p2 TRINITY_DN22549_c0_g2~~TRINITY_DN22549_c0_g2_i1.p2  ORF type:complete len:194 (-),score=22.06 TRINITY_DN22549_c0_g2_i1:534-1115(-)